MLPKILPDNLISLLRLCPVGSGSSRHVIHSTSNSLDTRPWYHDSYALVQQKQLNHIYCYTKRNENFTLICNSPMMRSNSVSAVQQKIKLSQSNLSVDQPPFHYRK